MALTHHQYQNLQRIGKVTQFAKTFETTRRLQGHFHWSHLKLEALPRTTAPLDAEGSRTGAPEALALTAVVASKKLVDRRAVRRNRVKRRIRPLMRTLALGWLRSLQEATLETGKRAPQSPHSEGYRLHWIVRPKKSALTASPEDLKSDVQKTFETLVQYWLEHHEKSRDPRPSMPPTGSAPATPTA